MCAFVRTKHDINIVTVLCINGSRTEAERRKKRNKRLARRWITYAKFKCCWKCFHIFALYDISIFHLCNFIIRAIVFASHFFTTNENLLVEIFENAYHTHMQTRERKRTNTHTWYASMLTFSLFNRQSSSVWIFQILCSICTRFFSTNFSILVQ